MRVLVVEDDKILKDGLRAGLMLDGFVVDAVETCSDAEAALLANAFDAIVLDLMLPDGSGLDLLQTLRASRSTMPVLLLTARDSVRDRIEGLDAGADDYLGKPFDLGEVAARLRALIRRMAGRASGHLDCNGIRIDPATRQVLRDGKDIRLSRREFAILHSLMLHPDAILSKSQIEDRLYGWQEEVESNAIEVHIHNVRSKLGADAIETVRGVGYRMGRTP